MASQPARRWSRRVLQAVVTAALAWFIADRVAADFDLDELRRNGISVGTLKWGALALATGVLAAGQLAGSLVWGWAVRDLGGPRLDWRLAAGVWLVGSLGRYAPGKVFGVVGVVALARKAGVRASTAAAAAVLVAVAGLLAAALIGSAAYLRAEPELGGERGWALAAVAVFLIAIFIPPLQRWAIGLWRRFGGAEIAIRSRGPVRWMALCVGVWLLHALAFWVMARSLGIELPIAAAGSAFALAWVLGHISPLPMGVGVREAGLVGLLAGYAPEGQLVGLALAVRAWTTVVELVVALAVRILATRSPWMNSATRSATGPRRVASLSTTRPSLDTASAGMAPPCCIGRRSGSGSRPPSDRPGRAAPQRRNPCGAGPRSTDASRCSPAEP